MEPKEGSARKTEQVLVRVSPDLFAALQLAMPFVGRRSMQDLSAGVLDDFVSDLADRDPGFKEALTGLAESKARRSGILAKRRAARRSG